MTCARDLNEWRRNLGKSKRAMAKYVGVGYSTWCRAERGEVISEASQKAIADKLGLTVVEAFREETGAAA